jgi:hypothetical protein
MDKRPLQTFGWDTDVTGSRVWRCAALALCRVRGCRTISERLHVLDINVNVYSTSALARMQSGVHLNARPHGAF